MKNIKKTLTLILTFCLLLSCLSLFASADSSIGNISTEQMIIPPTAEQAAAAVAASEYSISPVHLLPFIFDGSNPSVVTEIDISGCSENLLYVYNKNTDTVIQITNCPVLEYTSTQDHLYYVTVDQKVFKTDYTGSFHMQLYQVSEGTLSEMEYYGGKLYFIENEVQLVLLDVVTSSASTVFANKDLDSVFFFDTDKFIWRNTNNQAFYYNITTNASVALNNEHEINCVISPYVTPVYSEEETAEINYAGNNTNDITFPISPYMAGMRSYSQGYPTPQTYFKDEAVTVKVCNHPIDDDNANTSTCKQYAKTNQCDGFAVFAYEKYVHCATNAEHDPIFFETDDLHYCHDRHDHDGILTDMDHVSRRTETQFRDTIQSLAIGSFIRFGKDKDVNEQCKQRHSVIISGFNSSGVWFYECNNDDSCGIFHTFYTYAELANKYHCITYYAAHSFANTATSAANLSNVNAAERHIVECTHCDGYLLPKHRQVYKEDYSSTQHMLTTNCCNYVGYESHDATSLYTQSISTTTHQEMYGCCGHVKRSVTHTSVSHYIYSETKHKITSSCCGFLLYEDHVYSGNYPECLKCGYSPELGYLKAEDSIDTE